MPIYEYQCGKCHEVSEHLQKMSDPTPEQCPACDAQNTLTKVVSQSSFQLKGGGWYADAYSSKKPAEKKPAADKAGSEAGKAAPAASKASGGDSKAGSPTPAPAKASSKD